MKTILFVLLGAIVALALSVAPSEARVKHLNYLHIHHSGKLQKAHHANYLRKHHVKRAPALPPIVVANISIAAQTMSVSVNGWPEGYWRISSAREGYHTPTGSYRATRLAQIYFSKKYDNAPMPNSVFFYGGNAIHGTGHISQLGRPASHGCIRLHPTNAETFYELVEEYGPSRTRIIIQ